EIPGLARVLAGDGEDDVAAFDHHGGAGHAEAVHAVADDLLRELQVLLRGLSLGDERDPRPALEVDPQLGREPPVRDCVGAHEDDEEHQEEAEQQSPWLWSRVRGPGTSWCHGELPRFVTSGASGWRALSPYCRVALYRDPEVSEPVSVPGAGSVSSFSRITRRSHWVRTPGAISSPSVSSPIDTTVAWTPEVVRTLSPTASESCMSRSAFMALRCFELCRNIRTISTMIISGRSSSSPMWVLLVWPRRGCSPSSLSG